MVQVIRATHEILDQLIELAGKMSQKDFVKPLPILLENSISKHYRHIIEFYDAMLSGSDLGEINYDSRQHDPELEGSRERCLERIRGIRDAISTHPIVALELNGSYSLEGEEIFTIPTNSGRELVYNIEHTIHHMAIIRLALQHEFPEIPVGQAFGFAYSTLKHLNK
jgi:hypothetical protein